MSEFIINDTTTTTTSEKWLRACCMNLFPSRPSLLRGIDGGCKIESISTCPSNARSAIARPKEMLIIPLQTFLQWYMHFF